MPDVLIARARLRVAGVVQGVGFRPFVWRLAQRLRIAGEVCNTADGVLIDSQGEPADLDAFCAALVDEAPALARIGSIHRETAPPDRASAERAFRIVESLGGGGGAAALPVDTALCPACLGELFDTNNRRHRHALISCCDCGPRFTVTRRLPYDRAHTSMAPFAMCAACAAEYGDPGNRRFHAELISCLDCGPQLRHEELAGPACGSGGNRTPGDPLSAAWAAIARGEIVALEGLGGFQLICDAANPRAVARLRERKRRVSKPFALLVLNAASAAQWAHCDDDAVALLASSARPIVVLRRRADGQPLDGVAPGLDRLGLMLPSTPTQYLLFHDALGRPGGTQWLDAPQAPVLVATSANLSGEPLVSDPAHARQALTGIADAIVFHDRAIVARCDDSVVLAREFELTPLPLRRARGYAPQPLVLPRAGPPVLALGAHLKSTITLTDGAQALVSPYLGDLATANACASLDAALDHWLGFVRERPAALACDLQPDLYSTRLAQTLAARWDVPLLPVQHHHAHIAAVLAEHGHDGAALGLALDGFGWGDDGTAWGGELLHLEHGSARRLGHLGALPMPGGDAAARAPWRMALALLYRLDPHARHCPPGVDPQMAERVHHQIERGFNCPTTTSLGRWFDAIAGLAGICMQQTWSGEAALKLEALASEGAAQVRDWRLDGLDLDLLPLARWLADQTDPVVIASVWHATLARALAAWIERAMQASGIRIVALGGGCCANRTLLQGLRTALRDSDCTLLTARALPPGDDAISYGQAWVAIQQLQSPDSRP